MIHNDKHKLACHAKYMYFLVVTEEALHVNERILRNECKPFNNWYIYNQFNCFIIIVMTFFV